MENFTYDPVSRLTEHKTDAGNQSLNSYGYNTVGNLLTVGNKNQTYDAAGKVTVTGSSDVTYDARNNRTALIDTVDATNNVEYTWAQNNLLASVTANDDTTIKTVAYTYGAENLLQTRTEGALTEQFVWDTSRAIPAMLSDGKYEYVYSQDRVPLAQIEVATGTVTYLHKDLTGSVTASTDASGGLVGTVDYSPYGVATGSLLSHFGYAGEWVDSITGYSYLKARWLDTKTGTFLSEDPLAQMTNNAFGYTEGNPITQIDPLGLFTITTDQWGQIATTAGVIALGVGIAALATVSAPVWGPILAIAAVVATTISVVTTAYSTYRTCSEDGSWTGGNYTKDCTWATVGLGLSIIPVGGKLALPAIKRFYGFAASSPKGSTIDDLALNAWSGAAKVAVTVIDNTGLCADGLSRGLKNIDKY